MRLNVSQLLLLGCMLLALLVIAAGDSSPEQQAGFSFYEYFHGEWDVQKSTISLKTSEQSLDPMQGHYSMDKENGTQNLIGQSFDNDTSTGEVTNRLAITIDFTGPNSGAFHTGDTPDDQKQLFKFDFLPQPNGMFISHGEWNGASPAFYQFSIASWDKFTITVYPAQLADDAEITMYVGRKIPVNKEKSFFQKYSTMIMLGGFFLFQMFMQRKTRQAAPEGDGGDQPQAETATAADGTATPAGGAAAKKDD